MRKLLNNYIQVLVWCLILAGCSSSGDDTQTSTFILSVSLDGPGTGTVTSSPAGISCGSDCTEAYTENSVITLTASRATGSVFAGWSGACSGSDSCTLTMDAARSVTATFIDYQVDCSSSASYAPATPPVILSSGATTTTVIVMHGKAGAPLDVYLLPLYTALSDGGYDVVAPYMPWRDTVWDGSMCEAMNYVDDLAAIEAAKGNNVVIAGHSMGGAHALIYAASSPPADVKAVVTLAPGHFPHLELPLLIVFDPITAASITSSLTKAEDMVAGGNGDQLSTFDTLIPDLSNPLLQITATANDYLSYHALDQYPDINDVLPPIRLPVLWLAGDVDPLTDFYNMAALAGELSNPDSSYQLVTGDHLGMVANTAGPGLQPWR